MSGGALSIFFLLGGAFLISATYFIWWWTHPKDCGLGMCESLPVTKTIEPVPYRTMDRQPLPSPPLWEYETEEKCDGDCVCINCGHTCDGHHYFNSEYIGCNSAGQRRKSRINGKMVRHQPIPICKCTGFLMEARAPQEDVC